MPTICTRCRYVIVDSEAIGYTTYHCAMCVDEEQHRDFVTGKRIPDTYKLCHNINDGNCPYFERD